MSDGLSTATLLKPENSNCRRGTITASCQKPSKELCVKDMKKKKARKQDNLAQPRNRHRGIRLNGPFGRTLPGELGRSIIGAGAADCPRLIDHGEGPPGGLNVPMDTPPTGSMEAGQGCATTRKSRQARRRVAWQNKT